MGNKIKMQKRKTESGNKTGNESGLRGFCESKNLENGDSLKPGLF